MPNEQRNQQADLLGHRRHLANFAYQREEEELVTVPFVLQVNRDAADGMGYSA